MSRSLITFIGALLLITTFVFTGENRTDADTVMIEDVVFSTNSEGHIRVSLLEYASSFGTDDALMTFIQAEQASVTGITLNGKVIDLVTYAMRFDTMSLADIYNTTDELELSGIRALTGFEQDGSPIFSDADSDDEADDEDFGVVDIY